MKQTTLKEFPLRDIHPNPWRNLPKYELHEAKLETLRKSIEQSGFWPNLMGREMEDGTVEIAYGHHRREILRRMFPEDQPIKILIGDLDENDMLHMMASENDEHWSTSFTAHTEMVRAVMRAAKEGAIELPPANSSGGKGGSHQGVARQSSNAFNVTSIATYLGWLDVNGKATEKAQNAFSAVNLVDEGFMDEEDLEGLGARQAHVAVRAAKSTKVALGKSSLTKAQQTKHKKADKKAVKEMTDRMKTGELSTRDANANANLIKRRNRKEAGLDSKKREKEYHEVEREMEKYERQYFEKDSMQAGKMDELVAYSDQVPMSPYLAINFRLKGERLIAWADGLEAGQLKRQKDLGREPADKKIKNITPTKKELTA